MKILDKRQKPSRNRVAILERAWRKIPEDWQIAIQKVVEGPCFLYDPSEYQAEKKKAKIAWVYHPVHLPGGMSSTMLESEMAFLRDCGKSYKLYCRWYFEIGFVYPELYFRKHFVRTLGAAVYISNEKLRKVVRSSSPRWRDDPVAAELFFVDTFYKWWLWDHAKFSRERYQAAAACFGRIIEQSSSYL